MIAGHNDWKRFLWWFVSLVKMSTILGETDFVDLHTGWGPPVMGTLVYKPWNNPHEYYRLVISTINHWIQPLINQLNAILGAPSCMCIYIYVCVYIHMASAICSPPGRICWVNLAMFCRSSAEDKQFKVKSMIGHWICDSIYVYIIIYIYNYIYMFYIFIYFCKSIKSVHLVNLAQANELELTDGPNHQILPQFNTKTESRK